jgi:predicted phage tail component-like protein
MSGLKFNNKHSTELGLNMLSKRRNILPEPVIITEELPGMDGDYDYSNVNPDGRTKYKPFVDEIEFSFIEKNPANVRTKAHSIASWLACGESQLMYDDDPGKYWLARIINKLDIESQLVRLKSFTAQFKCQPYGYAVDEVQEVYEGIAAPVDKVIANPGTYVKPKITVTGSFTTLTLTCGGKTLTYSEAINGATIVIDNMQCIKDGAINVGNKLSGSFFEFVNGDNTLSIGGTGLNCSITVSFRPRYL